MKVFVDCEIYLVNTKKTPVQAAFNVSPRMTKNEVKEYLTKIYSVPVLKENTVNVLGKYKRLYAKRTVISYKRRNVKLAYVDMDVPKDEFANVQAIAKLIN